MTTPPSNLLARLGLLLQLSLPIGFLATLNGILNTFDSIGAGGDTAQAAAQITGGIATALKAAALAQALAGLGLKLLYTAVREDRCRAPWIYTWGRRALYCWLIFIPVGTIVGILGLSYLSKHRFEFAAPRNAE